MRHNACSFGFYSLAWTPLSYSYSSEILTFG